MDTPNADGIEYTDQHRTCLLGRIHTTLDQSVLPHVDLDLPHNVTYEQPALLDLLTYIAMEGEFANNGAKTRRVDAGDCTGIRRDDRSPLAKALGYQLRQLDRSTVTTQFETIVAAIRRLATRARLLTTPVDLAIDVHDWLFYGDGDTPMVANTNPDNGTDLAFTFFTACIVTPGTRLTVAVVPVATKAALPAAVDEALRAAPEWATIRRVFLDRGFYRVRVLDVLEAHDVDYVIRAPRFQSLDQGEPSVQVEQDYKVEQSTPPYDWVRVNRFTVPHAEAPNEKQMYFVTNRPIDEDSAEALAESYRQRWGVETSYRVIGDFLPQSRSTVYSVRLFYFLFATTLYNLWVLVNRLLTVGFALSATTVVLSAAVFGRIVQRQWVPKRPETD